MLTIKRSLKGPYTGTIWLPNVRLAGIRQRYHGHLIRHFCRQLPSAIQCALPQIAALALPMPSRRLPLTSTRFGRQRVCKQFANDSLEIYLKGVVTTWSVDHPSVWAPHGVTSPVCPSPDQDRLLSTGSTREASYWIYMQRSSCMQRASKNKTLNHFKTQWITFICWNRKIPLTP